MVQIWKQVIGVGYHLIQLLSNFAQTKIKPPDQQQNTILQHKARSPVRHVPA